MDASMFASLGVIKEGNKSIFRESPQSSPKASKRAKSLKASKSSPIFKSLTPLLSRRGSDGDSRVTMRRSASPTRVSERPFLSRIVSTDSSSFDQFESIDCSTTAMRKMSSEGVRDLQLGINFLKTYFDFMPLVP